MNLMSVDIPSVTGKPWGRLALAESARLIRGTEWLRVLVYLDIGAVSDMPTPVVLHALRDHLEGGFKWLVGSHLGFGVHHLDSPIRDPKGALRSLAVMIGTEFDFLAPRLRGDVLD